MSQEEVTHILQLCDAVWLHPGDPSAPHADLHSGKCSDGFVDVLRALRFTNICSILAEQLVKKFGKLGLGGQKIDWVIGSDHAGAVFSHSVAEILRAQHDFTEKGPNKTQLWQRFAIDPDEVVLQVEELITTTDTLQAVRRGIREGNSHSVKFVPVVGTLVHRSGIYEFEGSPIVYLAHYDINVWEPADCSLCARGSKRLKPKANWAELTGK